MPATLLDYPLLQKLPHDSQWLIHQQGALTPAQLMQRAQACAETLPEKKQVVILCEQQLNFFIAFIAAQLRRQTVLLPPNRSPAAIAEITTDYADSYSLRDNFITAAPLTPSNPVTTLSVDTAHIAAIIFSSGSTGKATASTKTWGSLVQGVHLTARQFDLGTAHTIVATVPPQHMYGLEMTVMLPLIAGLAVYVERPFYPEDVRRALQRCSGKRTLVTTPVHLRACVAAGLTWPKLDQVISATAPLDAELCEQAHAVFSVPVHEIFGSTETGALASRDAMQDEDWRLYESFRLFKRNACNIITAPHLDRGEVELADAVDILSPTKFRFLGRDSDMLNIAGKRASLVDLNTKLNAVSGVIDGVFLMPESQPGKTQRLVAFVVAPDLDAEDILATLAEQIDPVFLPRPLYHTDTLPRNETGKLPRPLLLSLLEKLRDKKIAFVQPGTIHKDHPSLVGHFPTNPVVPGVVILDKVREAMKTWQPEMRIASFIQIKFHAPLFPAQHFKIELQEYEGKYHFHCRRLDTIIASGIVSAVLQNNTR